MITFENCGHQDYHAIHQKQLEYWHQIVEKKRGETIIICSHPSIVTLGRKSTEQDLCGWKGEVQAIERGGKATYHGPGQLIIYPILDLKLRDHNVGGILRGLERATIETLLEWNIQATGGDEKHPTGIWINGRKLASIGIAVKRWVSFHGLAINLEIDPEAFLGINPCGFSRDTMISLEEVLGYKIDRKVFTTKYIDKLNKEFLI